jgi:hypothetical protein
MSSWWDAIGAVGSIAAAGVAAWAARQSRQSAQDANAAASSLVRIETDRRHSELCPYFKVTCEEWGPGQPMARMRIQFLGPAALGHLGSLTMSIRDDDFTRAEYATYAGGPPADEIKRQIWGPYRFTPGTGPHPAHADSTGRTTPFNHELPVGEILVFQLEPTTPPLWSNGMTPEEWQRDRGTLLRLAFDAKHPEFGSWTLACEIDLADIRTDTDLGALVTEGTSATAYASDAVKPPSSGH